MLIPQHIKDNTLLSRRHLWQVPGLLYGNSKGSTWYGLSVGPPLALCSGDIPRKQNLTPAKYSAINLSVVCLWLRVCVELLSHASLNSDNYSVPEHGAQKVSSTQRLLNCLVISCPVKNNLPRSLANSELISCLYVAVALPWMCATPLYSVSVLIKSVGVRGLRGSGDALWFQYLRFETSQSSPEIWRSLSSDFPGLFNDHWLGSSLLIKC